MIGDFFLQVKNHNSFSPYQYYIKHYKNNNKVKIFEKPTFEWLNEKNRLEKLLIGIGAGTTAVGCGILLAGLINLFVNFNAVTIDGEPIMNSYTTYYVLIGVGGGLTATGTALIIVGSIKLGLKNKKAKSEVSFLF